MSYLEIYNENIRDLLNPSSGSLELREDSRGRNIQVTRLSEVSTSSAEEVCSMKLMTYSSDLGYVFGQLLRKLIRT